MSAVTLILDKPNRSPEEPSREVDVAPVHLGPLSRVTVGVDSISLVPCDPAEELIQLNADFGCISYQGLFWASWSIAPASLTHAQA